LTGASAIGLITVPAFTSENYVSGGRAMQRIWLTAAKNNISVYPLMAPITFFARLRHGGLAGVPDLICKEIEILNTRFENLFPESKGRENIFLFILNFAAEKAPNSRRHSIDQVLSVG
jgi:hypothetical protein